MSRQPTRYTGRYVLADGRPRVFTAYAWNKSDAAAAVERQARETLTREEFQAALFYGVEKDHR
jgi:hypothetical protein